jgi:hypothetical protein
LEFLDSKRRIVLLTIAKEGAAGVTYDSLRERLRPILTESLDRVIEQLYFDSYIHVIKEGTEVRLIASKRVRDALSQLDLARALLFEGVNKAKKLLEEGQTVQEKSLAYLSDSLSEILGSLGRSFLILIEGFPELTIPELTEYTKTLYEFLGPYLKLGLALTKLNQDEIRNLLDFMKDKKTGTQDQELQDQGKS